MESTPRVAVGALGESLGSCLLWRYGGQLHLSVAIQARYTLQSEAPAIRCGIDDGHNLAAAADAVPYRESCDVWLAGHCNGKPLNPTAPVTTRLALTRGSESLLDQRLRVMHGSDVGVAGYGPRRRSAIAELEHGGVVELPRTFDWTQLHAAPPHQRVSYLEGDELLVLEGLVPDRPRLRCFLPRAVGAARVWPRGSRPTDEGHPIHLVADTLAIDSDMGTCAIVWRGSFPIPDDAAADRLILAAGVADAAGPLDWHEGWVIGNATAALGGAMLPSGTLELPAYGPADAAPFAMARPGSELRPADMEGAPWSERRPQIPPHRGVIETLDVEDTSDLKREELGGLPELRRDTPHPEHRGDTPPPGGGLPFRQAPRERPPESAAPITEPSPDPIHQTLDTPGKPSDPPPATPFEQSGTWPRKS